MGRLKNNVSWPEVMSNTGLSAGRVIAIFEGLVAGKDEETIARDYEIKLNLVREVSAFFLEETVTPTVMETHSEDADSPPSAEQITEIESHGS